MEIIILFFILSINCFAHDSHIVQKYIVPNYLDENRIARLNFQNVKVNTCLVDKQDNIEKVILIDSNKMIAVKLIDEDKRTKTYSRRIVFKNEFNREQFLINCNYIEDFNEINMNCFRNTSLNKYFCKKGE